MQRKAARRKRVSFYAVNRGQTSKEPNSSTTSSRGSDVKNSPTCATGTRLLMLEPARQDKFHCKWLACNSGLDYAHCRLGAPCQRCGQTAGAGWACAHPFLTCPAPPLAPCSTPCRTCACGQDVSRVSMVLHGGRPAIALEDLHSDSLALRLHSFPQFLELVVPHVLVAEQIHIWVPVAQECGT